MFSGLNINYLLSSFKIPLIISKVFQIKYDIGCPDIQMSDLEKCPDIYSNQNQRVYRSAFAQLPRCAA